MFDSVLGQGNIPQRKLGAGAAVSIGLHVLVVVGVLWLSSRPEARAATEVAVVFRTAAPPPPAAPVAAPPPPAGAAVAPARVTERKPVRKKTLTAPKEIPKEKPPEATPKPETPPEEAAPTSTATTQETAGGGNGVAGGVPGGVIGGVAGGVPGGRLGGETLAFGEGMTRPIQLEGRDPQYTREALAAGVQGVMIVKCVITTEGRLQQCRTIKPLPHMEQAVLEALATKRYKPVTFQGRPVAVDYVFQIRLVLPR